MRYFECEQASRAGNATLALSRVARYSAYLAKHVSVLVALPHYCAPSCKIFSAPPPHAPSTSLQYRGQGGGLHLWHTVGVVTLRAPVFSPSGAGVFTVSTGWLAGLPRGHFTALLLWGHGKVKRDILGAEGMLRFL